MIGLLKTKTDRKDATKTDGIPMYEGLPDVSEVIRLANFLFEAGDEEKAFDLLHGCRNLCDEMGLTPSVQTLSNEILNLRHQKEVDARGEDILTLLSGRPNGLLQTEIYKLLPEIKSEILRFACYRLAESGRVVRQKEGRSYLVRLPD